MASSNICVSAATIKMSKTNRILSVMRAESVSLAIWPGDLAPLNCMSYFTFCPKFHPVMAHWKAVNSQLLFTGQTRFVLHWYAFYREQQIPKCWLVLPSCECQNGTLLAVMSVVICRNKIISLTALPAVIRFKDYSLVPKIFLLISMIYFRFQKLWSTHCQGEDQRQSLALKEETNKYSFSKAFPLEFQK